MLPISESLLGAAYTIATRVVRGELDVDEETEQRLQKLRTSLEEVSELVGNLSPKNPSSWAGFAGRVMDEAYETHGRAESASEWLRTRGFDRSVGLDGAFVTWVCTAPAVEARVVYAEGDEMVALLELPGEITVAVKGTSSNSGDNFGLHRRPSTSRASVAEGIASAFWSVGDAARVSFDSGTTELETLDLADYEYRGEKRELIERWRKFLEAGIRRSVLLQGEPGTGKTTLCCHAARELGERTLVLTGEVVDERSTASWQRMLEMLAPSVVIVDDIDRPSEFRRNRSGGDRLRFFSTGRETVPLVLFTTNDHTRLPEAMRRPGRIDEIVRFEETSSDIRRDIVREIADEQGIQVSEERIEALAGVIEEYSAAHVREVLRRAEVLGWEAVSLEEQMFGMHREYQRADDWFAAHGFRATDAPPEFLLEEVLSGTEVEVAVETEHETVNRVELPTGAEFCFETDESETSVSFMRQGFPVRNAGEDGEKLCEGIAQVFWRGRRAVLLDALDRDYVAREVDYDDAVYLGPQSKLLDRLREYRAAGRRRSVLLQGPPGTGKSTLCLQAARELSERCIFLTPQCFGNLRVTDWNDLTKYLHPDMVIVDDVDRVGSRSLDEKLRMFEDRYCDIPFVLFTSNDAGELPRAMKRPGRIDQIIEIEPPDVDQRRRLIEDLAARIGVELPDERIDWLDAIYRDQSPAHVRELLLRAATLGWPRVTALYGDRTFDADWEGHDGPGAESPADQMTAADEPAPRLNKWSEIR